MSETPLEIRSHRGAYRVVFERGGLRRLGEPGPVRRVLVIDAGLARRRPDVFDPLVDATPSLLVEAAEASKSFERFGSYVEALLHLGVRRSDELVAVGGGVVQDITCFLAGIYLRGTPWRFHPTTLLAQADSCIGSKSSVNFGAVKNLLGTFTPPRSVHVDTDVLASLGEHELRSGLGEILKAHVIDGPASFDRLAADYPRLLVEPELLERYIASALRIKQGLVEADEFDLGPRQVLNYGHGFGHALESATGFAIPHGIAVSMGMDLANLVAAHTGRMAMQHHLRMHPTLNRNYAAFAAIDVPMDAFWAALGRDKKSTRATLGLVLPGPDARPVRVDVRRDATLEAAVEAFFTSERRDPLGG